MYHGLNILHREVIIYTLALGCSYADLELRDF